MKNGYMMTLATAVLAGSMTVGCGNKEKEEAAKPTHTAPTDSTGTTVTPPAMPTTAPSAMQSAADQMRAAGQSARDAATNAGAAASGAAQNLTDRLHATSMPSMPSMGH